MPKIVEGQQFTYWTTIRKLDNENNGKRTNPQWLCRCKCGTVKGVIVGDLLNGKTKSCGCYHGLRLVLKRPVEEIIGRQYNYWTIVKRIKGQKWLCRCRCGTERLVVLHSVESGISKSCGCYQQHQHQKRYKDVQGQVINGWTIIERLPTGKWLCRCKCGTERSHSKYEMRIHKSCFNCCEQNYQKKFIDITGQKFNNWTVIKRQDNGKWLCYCACGTEKELDSYGLRHGTHKSCGCLKPPKPTRVKKPTSPRPSRKGMFFIHIPAYTEFNNWTFIERMEDGRCWCRCRCGTEQAVGLYSLRYGVSKSCGCLKRLRDIAPGEQFGDRRVLQFVITRRKQGGGPSRRSYICECVKCGRQCTVQARDLLQGRQQKCQYCYHNRLPKEDMHTRLTKTKSCVGCGKPIPVWITYERRRNGRDELVTRHSKLRFCSKLCANNYHVDQYHLFDMDRGKYVGQRAKYFEAFGERKTVQGWSRDPRCTVSYQTILVRMREYGWSAEEAIITPSLNNKQRRKLGRPMTDPKLKSFIEPFIKPILTGDL